MAPQPDCTPVDTCIALRTVGWPERVGRQCASAIDDMVDGFKPRIFLGVQRRHEVSSQLSPVSRVTLPAAAGHLA